MTTLRLVVYHLLFLLPLVLPQADLSADDRAASELLPPTTVLYAELPQPGAILDMLQDHPLRKRAEALQGVKDYYESKQYLELQAAVAIVEAKLGRTWPNLLKEATAGGIALAVDAPTQGIAILVKAQDDKTHSKLINTLVELARADATSKDKPDPVKSGEHRGITAYQVGEAKVAAFGPWLLVTNKRDLGQAVLDAYLDKPAETLATKEEFQAARKTAVADDTAWGYADIAALRAAGVAKDLYRGKTDNPVAELLIGGLLDNLQHTPFAVASLVLDATHFQLQLATPHQQDWSTEAREYFFGPEGKGVAPGFPTIKNELAALTAYRDVSMMWLRAGDLFTDKMVDQLAQADSNLATFFSGKDFGEEVLGAVEPEVQLVVAQQTYEADAPQPAIKIPGFAAIFRLKEPEQMQPEFRRTFQSLIGFLNVVGAMNGQPQLDLDIDKSEHGQVVIARYLPDENSKDAGGLKMHYNFSPSVAFVKEYFIVSSTSSLARELSDVLVDRQPEKLNSNAVVRANAQGIREALAANRGTLIAQNMLEEGHTKEEAERAIDDLLDFITAFQAAAIDFRQTAEQLRLTLDLTFASAE